MLHRVYQKSPRIGVCIEKYGYISARKEIQRLSQEHNLSVADMPMILQALTHSQEIRHALRPQWIDTVSSEYHGVRGNENYYEVWHSAGSLATVHGLEKAFEKKEAYAFMPILEEEWNSIGKGTHEGKDIPRLHVDDLKKGNAKIATPYTVFARLDTDTFHLEPRGPLTYRTFMQDDRILMVSGSLENRDALAHLLFGEKEEGGEGWHAVENAHRMHDVCFETVAKGRPLCLGENNNGFISSELGRVGRFLCMDVHKVCEGVSQDSTILEQLLAIVYDKNLDREGMIHAVTQLYGK